VVQVAVAPQLITGQQLMVLLEPGDRVIQAVMLFSFL
jgi:hypothetical protein